jgi:glycosyltransferase involved in cell wall biosynthesis
MPCICMLLTNPCVNDSRVLREARALSSAGYEVRIVATQAEEVPRTEVRDGFRIVRVPSEPRLVRALQSLVGTARSLRLRAGRGRGPAPVSDDGEGAEDVFDRDAWVEAAGDQPGRALLRRNPRAAALRLGLRVYLALSWWRFARSAWVAVRDEAADVYLAHDLDTLPLGALAKWRLGGSLIYDSHELYTEAAITPPPSALWRPRWRLAERALIRKADAVVTVCDSIAEELAGRYGVARPTVVRNIPERVDRNGASEGTLRSRLGIARDARIALWIGKIDQNRRIEHLIEAVQSLPDVVVVLMGPGVPSYVQHLSAHAQRLGVGERVRIAEPVAPELVAVTAREADVALIVFQNRSLNDWYCLPSKLFESIQAGVPVVTNDWPELRRVVEGYRVGVLCESDDPDAIAQAVRSLLDDREGYERMRENARRASHELNWQRESEKLLSAIGAVVDGRPAGG